MRPRRSRGSLLTRRARAFARVLPRLTDGDVEGIHRARVAARRLREALPVVAGSLPGARRLRRTLRRLGRMLGPVREMDVSLALVEELGHSDRFDRASLDQLREAIARDRDGAWDAARDRLAHLEPRALARRLTALGAALRVREGAAAALRPAAPDWMVVLRARVCRRAEQARVAIDEAGALYLPDRIHLVRIAVKKLRYSVELAEEARGARTPSVALRRLKETQDLLGRLHDLQVLTDRSRVLQAAMKPARLTVWNELHILQRALEDECRTLHGHYMARRDGLLQICEAVRDGRRVGRGVPGRSRAAG